MKKPKRALWGTLGIVVGSLSLLLALVHFWAGPFSKAPTIESMIAKQAESIHNSAMDMLQGKNPRRNKSVGQWDADKITNVATATAGGLAFILGILGFARQETFRIAAGAVILGAGTIAVQFSAF